jgi:hypothetical protein
MTDVYGALFAAYLLAFGIVRGWDVLRGLIS